MVILNNTDTPIVVPIVVKVIKSDLDELITKLPLDIRYIIYTYFLSMMGY